MDGILYDEEESSKIYEMSEIHQSSMKATLRSREDLKVIRLLSFIAAILQAIVSAGLLNMGFNQQAEGISDDSYSVTIVLCGFGSLICCIWAGVGCYETVAGSRTALELPNWLWHNKKFIEALSAAFVLTFLLWPAIVIFIIHNQGQNFFSIIFGDVADESGGTRAPIILHATTSLLLMTVCGLCIGFPTKWLQNLNTPEAAEHMDEDEDMLFPEGAKKMMLGKCLMDILYTVDLIYLLVIPAEVNSGIVTMIVVHVGCSLPFFALWKKSRKRGLTLNVEAWLHKWRYAAVLHLFCSTVISWTAACVFTLLEHFNKDFWATLYNKNISLVYLQIALFLGYVIDYGFILGCHARCMSALDEIASLHLIEKHGATGVEMDLVEYDDDDDDDSDE